MTTRIQYRIPGEILLMIISSEVHQGLRILKDADIECFRLTCRSFYKLLPGCYMTPPYRQDAPVGIEYPYDSLLLLERYKFFKRLQREPNDIFSSSSNFILCYRCSAFRPVIQEPFPNFYLQDHEGDIAQLCEGCIIKVYLMKSYRLRIRHIEYFGKFFVTAETVVYRGKESWLCDRCLKVIPIPKYEDEEDLQWRSGLMHPHGCMERRSYRRRRWLCVNCHLKICYDEACGGWPEECKNWWLPGVKKSKEEEPKEEDVNEKVLQFARLAKKFSEIELKPNLRRHEGGCECEYCVTMLINADQEQIRRSRMENATDDDDDDDAEMEKRFEEFFETETTEIQNHELFIAASTYYYYLDYKERERANDSAPGDE